MEETLWDSVNKLRGSVEPAEYKHVVLGLIFLKFASDKFEYRRKEGIPLLRTNDLTQKGMSYTDFKYVTPDFHKKNKKSQLNKGDILVTRHGTNGMSVIFDANFEANCLNTIIIKPNSKVVSSKLIHCFLNSERVKSQIQSPLGGSVQFVLNTKIVSNLKFVGSRECIHNISCFLYPIQNVIEKKKPNINI
jgi:type I restriction enzyme S subunit